MAGDEGPRMAWAAWLVFGVVGAGALLLIADETEASHYRGGTLSWTSTDSFRTCIPTPPPIDPDPFCLVSLTVFEGRQAWHWSFMGSPAVGDLVQVGTLHFGDGNSAPLWINVTRVDAASDWMEGIVVSGDQLIHCAVIPCGGDRPMQHHYSNPGTYIAHFQDCCWIDYGTPLYSHINNAHSPFRLETVVTVQSLPPPVQDPVQVGSPKILSPLLVDCVQGQMCVVPIVAADELSPLLSYTFATSAEATGSSTFNQPGPPHAPAGATIVGNLFVWDTTGAQMAATGETLYSVAIMVRDGPQVKSPYQFMIRLH